MRFAGRIFLTGSLAGALAIALCAGCKTGTKSGSARTKGGLTAREAFDIGTEAYIFGYPLVTLDATRRVMTNVRAPEGLRAPMGQFARARTYPLASNHDVTVPNEDMLYTILWLDVSREPWVLSLPDMQGRLALFPLLDGWTQVFASLGKRTTGSGPQTCAIVGPGWKGKLPAGLKACYSPTSIVWVVGRIYCTGTPEDYMAVHALQDQCSAMPLSSYGQHYVPSPGQVDPAVDMKQTVREQVNTMRIASYFNRLAMLMKDNPPARADAPLLKKMARLGIVPGLPFDMDRLDPAVMLALQSVPQAALGRIMASFSETTKGGDWNFQNGWMRTLKTGDYGADYTQRALLAAIGLGATLPKDIVSATSTVDGDGKPYNGSSRYVMHFAPEEAPSASGFWSLTLYGTDCFFVENPLGRHALSARDGLAYNADGSLDLYLQRNPPAMDRESNWLPAPEGRFILMLRVYRPAESLLSGSWRIPPVKKAD